KHNERTRTQSPNALTIASIILASRSFLGNLSRTGMLDSIATHLVKILPEMVAPYLHLMIGFLGVPFDLLLSTDAYYFALLPVVEKIGTTFVNHSLLRKYVKI